MDNSLLAVRDINHKHIVVDWSQMNDISADGQGTFFKIEYQLATFVRMEELI